MRTTDLRAAGLVGGMRGDRSGRVAVAAPRPSLTWLLLVNLTRLTVSVSRWGLRHPVAATLLVLVALLLRTAGVLATGLVVVAAAAGLVVWSRRCPESFRRVVMARWRRVWTYGRWWQAAMVACELARQLDGREYLPRLRRVSCPSTCVDRLRVDLLSGQSPEDFERHTGQLAHTFAVERVRVVVERPGRIVLEVTHRDGLTEVVDPLTPAEAPDVTSLPVGRCEDGMEWTLRLLGTHLLVAGATGAGKGSVVWSLVRSVGPLVREGSVQLWAVDPKGGMELTPGAVLFARFAYADTASMVGCWRTPYG